MAEKEMEKVGAIWLFLHLIKKNTPRSSLFWMAQYVVMYTQLMVWPITQVVERLRWRPAGMFTFVRATAQLICGTEWASWPTCVIVVLACVVLHAVVFGASIIYAKLRSSQRIATWLSIYFSLVSHGLLMIFVSKAYDHP